MKPGGTGSSEHDLYQVSRMAKPAVCTGRPFLTLLVLSPTLLLPFLLGGHDHSDTSGRFAT